MTKNEELLLRLEIFKVITEYQIQWLSTSYDMPGLSYHVITKRFPQINNTTAMSLLNEWIQYEKNSNIPFYNKQHFEENANLDVILKLKGLIRQLDTNITTLKKEIIKENPTVTIQDLEAFKIEKTDNEIVITFFNPSWFKKNNVVNLTFDEARELYEKLKAIL